MTEDRPVLEQPGDTQIPPAPPPASPKPPFLPRPPTRDTRVVRRSFEALRRALRAMRKTGASPEKQQEMKDLIEEVRRTAYEAGRAAGRAEVKMEMMQGATIELPADKVPKGTIKAPPDDEEAYVSRTPFATTQRLTLDYLQKIGRAAGPTEIIRNTQREKGIRLTHTTVRRALDALVESGAVKEVDQSRWEAAGKK